ERRRRDPGMPQFTGGCRGILRPRPGGEGIVDRLPLLRALSKSEPDQRRQSRYDSAQASPFLVLGDREADPMVRAGAAVGAMRSIAIGEIADRLCRGYELLHQ